MAMDVDEAQEGRDDLGYGRRHRRAGDAEAEVAYEEEVQHRVEDARDHQELERRLRIPYALERLGQCVVEVGERDAEKDDPQIHRSDVVYGWRHVQKPEQRVDEDDAQCGQDQREDRA